MLLLEDCVTGGFPKYSPKWYRRYAEVADEEISRLRGAPKETAAACACTGRTPYDKAKQQADERGKAWELSEGDYALLVSTPCFYCGGDLGEHGVRLDRKNSEEGYRPDNVVPCCYRCKMLRVARVL